ncbi:hypothetical protein IW261DRAFT_789516 [Armillaria novae-zelandiae]|uniref:Uncharacterized protein n=1 Tax=Armillaria novae-zelandiae TaxID=153914 RepID=A0AA39UEJ6_9AGAR|nr:hypothetical protein IW261DRAFT_789516 [Armillaria novae-zelandiae]
MRKVVVETLTTYLNGVALEALVHGMYTFSCRSHPLVHLYAMNKPQYPTQSLTPMVVFNPTIRLSKSHTSRMSISVVLMYLFTTLNLGIRWSWMRSPLVFSRRDAQNGTAYYTFGNADDTTLWAISGAATGANILIADAILVSRGDSSSSVNVFLTVAIPRPGVAGSSGVVDGLSLSCQYS